MAIAPKACNSLLEPLFEHVCTAADLMVPAGTYYDAVHEITNDT